MKLDDILETYSLPRPTHETGEAREMRDVASWNELGRSQVLGWCLRPNVLSGEIAFDKNLENIATILFGGNAIDTTFEVIERAKFVKDALLEPKRRSRVNWSQK